MPKQTDVKAKFSLIGVAEVQRDLGRLHKSNEKAVKAQLKDTKTSQEEVKKLRDRLKDLTITQIAMMKAVSETGDKGSKEYKELAKALKGVEREGSRVERTIKRVERVIGDTTVKVKDLERTMAKGSFAQGLMQGAMPRTSGLLQRGPGMKRQVAGQMLGRGVRGVGGAIGGTPFGGIGAIAQGLQSIPGGGLIAAPMRMAAQYAGTALSFQRQRLAAGPGMSGLFKSEAADRKRARDRATELGLSPADIERRATEAGAGVNIPSIPKIITGGGAGVAQAELRAQQRALGAKDANDPEVIAAKGAAKRALEQRDAIVAGKRQDLQQQRRGLFGKGSMQAIGQSLGMTAQEVLQTTGMMSQIGGGTGGALRSQGLGQVGLAAQTQFGIGANVSGQFLRAGRSGGLQGGLGRGGDAMTEAIREGLQLGLTGSDLVDHMSDVADGINAWKSTGMPMNKEALQTFKAGAAGLGLGSIRGGAVGKGLMQGIQGIGQRGIKSAADLFFATEVGGLKGMGPDEVLEAQIAMEQLKKGEGGKEMSTRALGALRKLAEAGGGGIGSQAFRVAGAMESLGVKLAPSELKTFTEKLTAGEKLNPNLLLPRKPGAGPKSQEELLLGAQEHVSKMAPNLKRQAEIANEQLAAGERMMKAVQGFEAAQTAITGSFAKMAGEPLNQVADFMVGAAETLPKLLESMTSFVGWFETNKDSIDNAVSNQ